MKLPTWLWFLLPFLVFLWSAWGVVSAYARYEEARRAVRALEREVEALTQRLPQALAEAPVGPGELPQVYEVLLRLAEEKGLGLLALGPGPAEAVGGVRAWRLALELQGPYAGVLGYIEALASLKVPLWVEGYALEPQEAGGEPLELSLSLRVLAP
ncbi:hypothetical protein [Thermus sp.]|uniref:hypothetical protein n=1 Tax=Thermus sp. TaxID=275 RepID=UPI00307F7A24